MKQCEKCSHRYVCGIREEFSKIKEHITLKEGFEEKYKYVEIIIHCKHKRTEDGLGLEMDMLIGSEVNE